MNEDVLSQLVYQQNSLTRQVKSLAEQVSDEQLQGAPSDAAPPAGWHLWHIARWSDRFQAGLQSPGLQVEVWAPERLAARYGLDPHHLGVLELGMSMEPADARALPALMGREGLLHYLRRVLDAALERVGSLDPEQLLAPRPSIREYASVNGVLQYAPPQESTLLADILFHQQHAARHLGSMEALRGL